MLFAIIGTSDRGNFVFDRWPRNKTYPKITRPISANELSQLLAEEFYYFGIYRKKAIFRTAEAEFSEGCFIEIFNANQKRLEVVVGIDDQCVMVSRSVFIINNQRNFYPLNTPQITSSQILSNILSTSVPQAQAPSAPPNSSNCPHPNPAPSQNPTQSTTTFQTNPLFCFKELQQDRKDIVNSITLVWQASRFEEVDIIKDKLSFMVGVLRYREEAEDYLSKQIIKITQARQIFQNKVKQRCLELTGTTGVSSTPINLNKQAQQLYDQFKVRQMFQQFYQLAEQYLSQIQIFKQISKFYQSCVSDSQYTVSNQKYNWYSSVGHDYKVPKVSQNRQKIEQYQYSNKMVQNRKYSSLLSQYANSEMDADDNQSYEEELNNFKLQRFRLKSKERDNDRWREKDRTRSNQNLQQIQDQVEKQLDYNSQEQEDCISYYNNNNLQRYLRAEPQIDEDQQQILGKATLATHKKILMLPEVLRDQRIDKLYNTVVNITDQNFKQSINNKNNALLNQSGVHSTSSNQVRPLHKDIPINSALHTIRFLKQNQIAVSIYPINHQKYYNLYALKKLPSWSLIKKFNTRIFPGENILRELHSFGRFRRVQQLDEKLDYIILQDLVAQVDIYVYYLDSFRGRATDEIGRKASKVGNREGGRKARGKVIGSNIHGKGGKWQNPNQSMTLNKISRVPLNIEQLLQQQSAQSIKQLPPPKHNQPNKNNYQYNNTHNINKNSNVNSSSNTSIIPKEHDHGHQREVLYGSGDVRAGKVKQGWEGYRASYQYGHDIDINKANIHEKAAFNQQSRNVREPNAQQNQTKEKLIDSTQTEKNSFGNIYKYNLLMRYVNKPYNLNEIIQDQPQFQKISQLINLVMDKAKNDGYRDTNKNTSKNPRESKTNNQNNRIDNNQTITTNIPITPTKICRDLSKSGTITQPQLQNMKKFLSHPEKVPQIDGHQNQWSMLIGQENIKKSISMDFNNQKEERKKSTEIQRENYVNQPRWGFYYVERCGSY